MDWIEKIDKMYWLLLIKKVIMNIIIEIQNVSCPNQMLAATLFAGYKCIGVQMLLATLLATNKCVGGQMLIKSTFSEVDFLLEMR